MKFFRMSHKLRIFAAVLKFSICEKVTEKRFCKNWEKNVKNQRLSFYTVSYRMFISKKQCFYIESFEINMAQTLLAVSFSKGGRVPWRREIRMANRRVRSRRRVCRKGLPAAVGGKKRPPFRIRLSSSPKGWLSPPTRLRTLPDFGGDTRRSALSAAPELVWAHLVPKTGWKADREYCR